MSNYNNAIVNAREVSEGICEIKETDVRDIILYGSVAKKTPDPEDVDLLVIYGGKLPEEFPPGYEGRKNLTEELLDRAGFHDIEFIPPIDLQALPVNFFQDWSIFKHYIETGRDYLFYRDVFDTGWLFNPSKKDFTSHALTKYRPARDAVETYARVISQLSQSGKPTVSRHDIETLEKLFPSVLVESHFLQGKLF